MLSPATLAALHRLVAMLLVLIDALAAPMDGAPRPLLTRLAIGALSISLKRLAARLTEMANDAGAQPTPDPAHTPHPTRAQRIRVRRTPPTPRFIRSPSSTTPNANPLHLNFERQVPPPQHAKFIT